MAYGKPTAGVAEITSFEVAPKRRGPASPKWCSVYLVETASGVVKIGMSSNPQHRLEGLRTSAHEKLSLEHSWRLVSREQAAALEHRLHQLFKWARKAREWFDVEVRHARSVGDALIAGEHERAARLAHEIQMSIEAYARSKAASERRNGLNTRWRQAERLELGAEADKERDTGVIHEARAFALGLEQNEWDEMLMGDEIAQARRDLGIAA